MKFENYKEDRCYTGNAIQDMLIEQIEDNIRNKQEEIERLEYKKEIAFDDNIADIEVELDDLYNELEDLENELKKIKENY